MSAAGDLISSAEAATLAGVKASTFRTYVATGRGPLPVVRGFYRRAEVVAWIANRPGQGARTDLRREE